MDDDEQRQCDILATYHIILPFLYLLDPARLSLPTTAGLLSSPAASSAFFLRHPAHHSVLLCRSFFGTTPGSHVPM